MDSKLLEKVEEKYIRTDLPDFNVGDTITVAYKVRDEKGGVRRVQNFKGLVLAIKNSGARKTFTVRKIAANEIGVERIFPLHSPNIESITVEQKGKVRRSKIYYMRKRIGKAAMKVKRADDMQTQKKTSKQSKSKTAKKVSASAKSAKASDE